MLCRHKFDENSKSSIGVLGKEKQRGAGQKPKKDTYYVGYIFVFNAATEEYIVVESSIIVPLKSVVIVSEGFTKVAEKIVCDGEKATNNFLSPEVERYVVDVLRVWFNAGPERLRYFEKPLGVLVCSNSVTEVMIAGELGLLLASWFSDRSWHFNISPSHYASIAQSAYWFLATKNRKEPWGTIAGQVGEIVAVLSASAWNKPDEHSLKSLQEVNPYFQKRFQLIMRATSKQNVLAFKQKKERKL